MKLHLVVVLLLVSAHLAYDNVGRVLNSNLTLHWSFVPGGLIDVKLEYKQPSFVPLLLGNSMTTNDLWVCSLETNATEWTLYDRW